MLTCTPYHSCIPVQSSCSPAMNANMRFVYGVIASCISCSMFIATMGVVFGQDYRHDACQKSDDMVIPNFPLWLIEVVYTCWDVSIMSVAWIVYLYHQQWYQAVKKAYLLVAIAFDVLLFVSLFTTDARDCHANALWSIGLMQGIFINIAIFIESKYWDLYVTV
jgi:hypothetical protein